MEEKMVKFILLFLLFACFSGFIGLCNAAVAPQEHLVRAQIISNKTIRNSAENKDIYFTLIPDYIWLLEIDRGAFISSAQIEYRRFPPPEEQVCKTINNGATSMLNKKFEKFGFTFVHPEFGYLTFANNIALSAINFTDTNRSSYEYAKIYRDTKLEIGQELMRYDTPVKVVDFKNCMKAFDPDQRYLLDEEEQFCTTAPSGHFDHFPNGFFFIKDTLNLVGIESINNGEFVLSTFVPYHCDGFIKMFAEDGKEMCVEKEKITMSLTSKAIGNGLNQFILFITIVYLFVH